MYKPVDQKPDFPKMEEELVKFWESSQIFQKTLDKNQGKETFVVYDGPPTANAKPPLHTSMPMAFKDLVGRYQTMKGKFVPRQAGWDTHGLPVEVQVEKALGLAGKQDILNLVPGDESASIRLFNEKCQTSVWEFKQEWDKFVPRIGYFLDIESPYVTYDTDYVNNVWGVFKQIYDKDLVYKGFKVIPYCPRCGTALSAAEVAQEYQDVRDTSVYISFNLVDEDAKILAWTTTPWTLPGNVALAVGPDIDYVLVSLESGKYYLAKSRLSVFKEVFTILDEMKGKDLVGKKYQPLFEGAVKGNEKAFQVVPADFVTTEDGTGVVHTAVMYGVDDFELGEKIGLPKEHTVGPDGKFLPNVKEFASLDVHEALVPILKSLAAKEVLYKKEVILHSYPHCWRCKTKLLYYAKDSWFIAMSSMREQLVKANQEVEWYPEHIKDGRFGDFIKEARDWAISRERFWGTPMPLWVAPSGKIICVGSINELKSYAKLPDDFNPHRPFVDDILIEKDGESYKREPLVLDVWFDSGAMPFASNRFEKGEYPADYIAEAIDQTRGWFYTLMAIGVILTGKSPYKRVTCMGHLVDENGKKMSKSLGNVFNPWELFQVCGVDAIRWFYYTTNPAGESKSLGIKGLQTTFRKSVLLLWNIFNYFVTYANLHENPEKSEMSALDKWVLSRKNQTLSEVTAYMDNFDFMRGGRAIEELINDVSTWYLRRSRKRDDSAFFEVMEEVLIDISTMLAPYMPFVSESIFQVLKKDGQPESVHLMDWPVAGAVDDVVLKDMAQVRSLVELGLSIRAEQGIKVRQPLASVLLEGYEIGLKYQEILAEELNVLEIISTKVDASYVARRDLEGGIIALDMKMTDELVTLGFKRELSRKLADLRKNTDLKAGQWARLIIDPSGKSVLSDLLDEQLLTDLYFKESVYLPTDKFELLIGEETVLVNVESL